MPSLVVIGQEIKEKRRGYIVPPAYMVLKYPSLNRVKPQIHLIIISRDRWLPIGSNMTCVHLLPRAKFEFRDSSIQHRNCLICCLLNHHICQCMRRFFVKKPKFLAATFNLRVEQNLVHLGRFLHFSQKVVGVTLKCI